MIGHTKRARERRDSDRAAGPKRKRSADSGGAVARRREAGTKPEPALTSLQVAGVIADPEVQAELALLAEGGQVDLGCACATCAQAEACELLGECLARAPAPASRARTLAGRCGGWMAGSGPVAGAGREAQPVGSAPASDHGGHPAPDECSLAALTGD